MDTSLPKDPKFNKYYEKHGKYLRLKGLRPKTIEAYSRAIRRIGNYFDARIDRLTSDQLLDYFNDLLQSHSWSAVKLDLYGLKFFYTHVLKRTWEDIPLIKPPKGTRIPDILTIEQANQLFSATNKLSYKVFFFTIYSMGLRLGEGIKLTVGDIDPINMRVHIPIAAASAIRHQCVPRIWPINPALRMGMYINRSPNAKPYQNAVPTSVITAADSWVPMATPRL
jgi:site-specific recombinase XerD